MTATQVIVRLVARPGSEQVVRDVLATLIEPVRHEPGCLAYTVFESTSNAGTFFDIATWANDTARDLHTAAPHVQHALATLDGHLVGSLEVDVLRTIPAPDREITRLAR